VCQYSGASTPLTVEGKCLLKKVGGSEKLKTGGKIFRWQLALNTEICITQNATILQYFIFCSLHFEFVILPCIFCFYCLNCTEFGLLIFCKISEIVPTRCHKLFNAKMHQIQFRLGLCPRPYWEAYYAPSDLLARFKTSYFQGKWTE